MAREDNVKPKVRLTYTFIEAVLKLSLNSLPVQRRYKRSIEPRDKAIANNIAKEGGGDGGRRYL